MSRHSNLRGEVEIRELNEEGHSKKSPSDERCPGITLFRYPVFVLVPGAFWELRYKCTPRQSKLGTFSAKSAH